MTTDEIIQLIETEMNVPSYEAEHILSVLMDAGVIQKPVTTSRYYNPYDSDGSSTIFRYNTREDADHGKSDGRIAVLRLDITDGVVTSHIEPL